MTYWRELLGAQTVNAVWVGGSLLFYGDPIYGDRTWRIGPPLPEEHGWYMWRAEGRVVTKIGPASGDTPPPYAPPVRGYLCGGRIAREGQKTLEPVMLVPAGLLPFARVVAARYWADGPLVFLREELPLGPEDDLRCAFEDRLGVETVKGVTPELEAVFRQLVKIRDDAEARQARAEVASRAAEARLLEERRRAAIEAFVGTGAGRRRVALSDFEAAARAALRVGGAELLGVQPQGDRFVVRYRTAARRFECVADASLNVLDAGICLDGDDELCTLETLPMVVRQAIQLGVLHVYRYA